MVVDVDAREMDIDLLATAECLTRAIQNFLELVT